ncbi:hypothetical protein [Catenovulum sediminis]|uniref:Uncharacterized protein n=1 Tax=Catenovulum sediminis TaxID=1740262 RepID=A0ABV1RD50_9ALTE
MLKKIKILAIAACGLVASSMASAGQGKAIISHWGSVAPHNASYVYVSNISENTVNVKITYYDKDGNALSPSTFSNFVASNTQLLPKSSGFVSINTGTWNYGYAVVEWSNLDGDDDTVALVANAHRVMDVTTGLRSDLVIQVNNGQPF